jgi:beta-glucosidase
MQRTVTKSHAHPTTQTFPTGFRWGVATAAYQIEGAADEGGRQPSIWDTFSRVPGNIMNGDSGDVACDHYHRFKEDIALMESIGVTDYRLSISWSRLLTGKDLNPEGVDFYRRLLMSLLDVGITPWVTLYHWDLPQWLEDAGGWPFRETAQHFADYAVAAHAALGDLARNWITVNEPINSSLLGYAGGIHAPGHKSPLAGLAAAHHLHLGHGMATRAIKERDPTAQVGPTFLLTPVHPATSDAADQAAAAKLDGTLNRLFLDPVFRAAYPDDLLENVERYGFSDVIEDGDLEIIGSPVDFLGVNYYFRVVASSEKQGADSSFDWRRDAWVGCEDVHPVEVDGTRTEMGWEIYPDGMTEVLTRVSRDYTQIPVYITESGAAFADDLTAEGQVQDHDRVDYMRSHISRAKDAIDQGVDLRGYFAWSLLDNFEWTFGYAKRFGLVHVDFKTQVRTPKLSAAWYQELILNNRLST